MKHKAYIKLYLQISGRNKETGNVNGLKNKSINNATWGTPMQGHDTVGQYILVPCFSNDGAHA